MNNQHIKYQLEEVRLRISQAAEKAGRNPADVKLIAVSKTFSVEAVMAAYDAGQRLFGENRVQEMLLKAEKLPVDIEWHLIGHLQSNKAGNAIKTAEYIHSVDSDKLLVRLNHLAEENSKKQKILLEINISGEKSKFGISTEKSMLELAESTLACKHIEFVGLMTMAPFGADSYELHKNFSGLREFRDKVEQKFCVKLPELSMGMSSDYESAISEGATFLRIGTSIFGERTYSRFGNRD